MITVVQNQDIYEIRFPYDEILKDIIKSVAGRQWHPDDKCWSIPADKLGFLLTRLEGTDYESQVVIRSDEEFDENAELGTTGSDAIPDIDISDVRTYVQEGGRLFEHQLDCLKFSKGRKDNNNFNGFILADEMGCVSANSEVQIHEQGEGKMTRRVTIKHLKELFEKDNTIKIKCMVDDRFKYMPIKKVIYSGYKYTIRITLSNGDFLECTEDHEIYTENGWVEAGNLRLGDMVFTSGIELSAVDVCSICHIGYQDVYDITIDDLEIHNFVCNDIVVHNCGKTLEVINLALFKKQYEGAKHCLIICCINSAKYNWAEDIKKHTNGEYEGYLLGSRLKRNGAVKVNGTGKDKFEDLDTGYMYGNEKYGELPYFLILNIEALRTTGKSRKRDEKYIITNKIIDLVMDGQITMIALDEIHRNASPTSTQGKQILKIKEKTRKRVEWIPMTGTPIVNKPTDVFLPLRLVDGHQVPNYYTWKNHYCVMGGYGDHQIVGYKNISELKSMLEPNMLRRLKSDILDLPPKIRHNEYVENTKYQQKLYSSIKNEIADSSSVILASSNPLSKLLRLRQVNGCPELIDPSIDPTSSDYIKYNAKIERMLQLVEEITSQGEKVVIFSNWVEPLRTAYRFLVKSGYNVASYVGTMPQEDREKNKQAFIHNKNVDILLGTIGAMGTSHTLTVARNVIFLDQPWNAATLEQAEDRCHRTGTTGTVNIYNIITKDTVDERVYNLIMDKKCTSDYIVDNNLDLRNNPALLEYLISD